MPIFHLIGLGASRMLKSQPPNPVFVSAAFPELRSPETCFYFPLIPNKCQADTFGPPTIAKWLRRCEKKGVARLDDVLAPLFQLCTSNRPLTYISMRGKCMLMYSLRWTRIDATEIKST